ncbi:LysE family translocator [Aurantimonas sp. VKM B-3413]|uniref:LysE family translocator n=1 Tax=Aurantimonas sp. VKM B-3413 TaxID=2779401 RepID=UPI001E59CFD0|nr:LysE family translocator [Aurantimonas sp. VKM B-3413]MCB8837162.1 LysE family translocator [Aurantimonas sp. VKM B-3413]
MRTKPVTSASLSAYALALAIAAAIPGPGVMALVGRALGSGFRHGLLLISGVVLGDIVYLTAACFGLALIAHAFGDLFVLIRTGAAIYLAYLAIKMWTADTDTGNVEALSSKSLGSSFSAGLLVTLSNPKTIFFYLALLPSILDLGAIRMPDFLLLALVTAPVLFVVLTPYAALAAGARGAIRNSAVMKSLNRTAAAILAGTAVWTLMRRA